MIIRQFEDNDIEFACKLAKLVWGDFYTSQSEELQSFIYNFTLKYYDLNRDYSFSIIEKGLKGFILAFDKADCYDPSGFHEHLNFLQNHSEQKIALDLFNYLETCGKETKNLMNNDDIMLGLFVSIQKGCGKQLFSKLVETCKKNNKKNIYLWTDTTCDYEYYRKNNFILHKEFETCLNGKKIKTLIYQKGI